MSDILIICNLILTHFDTILLFCLIFLFFVLYLVFFIYFICNKEKF